VGFGGFGGGTWPFYGVARSSVFVESNGNLCFGSGDTTFNETEAGIDTGPARIAPIWDDFFPPGGGQVRSSQTSTTITARRLSALLTPERRGPRGHATGRGAA
jgi:hypothetical protein